MSEILARRQFVSDTGYKGRVHRFTVNLWEYDKGDPLYGSWYMTVVMDCKLRQSNSELLDDPREIDIDVITVVKAILLQPQDMHRMKLVPDPDATQCWKLEVIEPLDLMGASHTWVCELVQGCWRHTHGARLIWYPGKITTRRRRRLNSLLMVEKL